MPPRRAFISLLVCFAALDALASAAPLPATTESSSGSAAPVEWRDPASGHLVRRLTNIPGMSCGSLYFHQEIFTADGKSLIFVGKKDDQRRVYLLDLATGESRPLTHSDSDNEVLAPKSRQLFFTRGRGVHAVSLDTGEQRLVANLPAEWDRPTRLSVNADETLLASTEADGLGALKKKLGGGRAFDEVFAARLHNRLFTVEVATGTVRVIHEEDTWLGHVQFSPTDPGQLMFCHEGPWAALDRIWLIRADGTGLRLAYKRQVAKEIAGHEFWSADGKTIWFDNPFPARENGSLSRLDLADDRLTRFPLAPELVSVHFNRSPDGSFLVAEGGATNKRLTLLRLKDGRIEPELLTSLDKHNYKIEPDTHVSPDGRWVVFHSDQQGDSQLYAVAVAANPAP